LSKKLTEQEINVLCQKQAEIIQLTTQIKETTEKGEKQLAQISNNIGGGDYSVEIDQ